MHLARLLVVLILVSSLVGCGGGLSEEPVTVTPPASTEAIKAVLTDLAKSGEMSSGVMTIETEIEKLRTTDAAKADALKQGYDQLKDLNDPAKIKAKAQEMMSKL